MRYLTIIFTLALVVCLTTTAKADVENVRVGGDVGIRYINREDLDLTDKTRTTNTDDSWFDSTVRLQIDAELSDDVASCIRLINERDWDAANSGVTEDVELDLGYMTLDNMFGYPVKATLGRQEILFGEGFLVGDGYGSVTTGDLAAGDSVRKAFDALRLSYSAEPYTVDVFTAKIDEDFGAGAGTGDVDLNGININYDYLDIATFDLGYFVKSDSALNRRVKALSLRGEGSIPAVLGLTVKGEYVDEDGDSDRLNARGSKDLDASAWYLGAEYAFQDMMYEPYIGVTYTVMSGDKDSNTAAIPANDDEQFDPLYQDVDYGAIAELLPASAGGEIQTNLNAWTIAAGLKPTEALSVDVAYNILKRDETASGVDDDLGDELDITLTYDYTEDVQFGLCAAWFNPGGWFDDLQQGGNDLTANANRDETATQIVGSVKVSF